MSSRPTRRTMTAAMCAVVASVSLGFSGAAQAAKAPSGGSVVVITDPGWAGEQAWRTN